MPNFENSFNPVNASEDTQAEVEKLNKQLEGEASDHFEEEWGLGETLNQFKDTEGYESKRLEILSELQDFVSKKEEPEDGDLNISRENWNEELTKTMEGKIAKKFSEAV